MVGNPVARNPPKKMTLKVSSLRPGQKVAAGYRKWSTPNTFMGFGLDREKDVQFSDLRVAYTAADCKNLKQLEDWANTQGKTVYAVFRDPEDGVWAAYLWKGCFRVGTSADRLTLKVHSEFDFA